MTLRIERLSKTYENGTVALRDVSLTIPRGMFGLLGPNGAGKSTLMRIIATLQEPDQGSVLFDDIDALADKQAIRRLLGYLPQEFGLYRNVSAEELLDHFAVLKGITDKSERKRIVDRLFEQTNLAPIGASSSAGTPAGCGSGSGSPSRCSDGRSSSSSMSRPPASIPPSVCVSSTCSPSSDNRLS